MGLRAKGKGKVAGAQIMSQNARRIAQKTETAINILERLGIYARRLSIAVSARNEIARLSWTALEKSLHWKLRSVKAETGLLKLLLESGELLAKSVQFPSQFHNLRFELRDPVPVVRFSG